LGVPPDLVRPDAAPEAVPPEVLNVPV